ncbi:unnamed protein product, partial [Ectocarpus sp. 4 AP-2014]
ERIFPVRGGFRREMRQHLGRLHLQLELLPLKMTNVVFGDAAELDTVVPCDDMRRTTGHAFLGGSAVGSSSPAVPAAAVERWSSPAFPATGTAVVSLGWCSAGAAVSTAVKSYQRQLR